MHLSVILFIRVLINHAYMFTSITIHKENIYFSKDNANNMQFYPFLYNYLEANEYQPHIQ